MDIYINGKVFVYVKKPKICPRIAYNLNIDYVSSFTSYRVYGSHNWNKCQDVSGMFDLVNIDGEKFAVPRQQ